MAKPKQKLSFSDMLNYSNERDRILTNYVHKGQEIKDFGEFKSALLSSFSTPKGDNAMIDEQDIIDLFESDENKFIMNMYLEKEESEKLFGDGMIVERQAITERKMVVITSPKIKYRSYTRKGKVIQAKERTSPKRFSNSEIQFIKVRKLKKIPQKKIIEDYNRHFSNNPRTSSSISHKLYRI